MILCSDDDDPDTALLTPRPWPGVEGRGEGDGEGEGEGEGREVVMAAGTPLVAFCGQAGEVDASQVMFIMEFERNRLQSPTTNQCYNCRGIL